MSTSPILPQMQPADIGLLKPYWNNPRVNDEAVEGLKKSISEFGFMVPIVVDQDFVIVTGHTRFKASVELGLLEVPVIVATHLSEQQIKAFRIADNRLSENAKWDENKLSDELRQIKDMGFGLEFTGFSKEELDCLCGSINASCLDDMDYASVCGAIAPKAFQARDNVLMSMGNYKFYVSTEAYKAWEGDLLNQFPKRADLTLELMRRLGFTPVIAPPSETPQPAAEATELTEAQDGTDSTQEPVMQVQAQGAVE